MKSDEDHRLAVARECLRKLWQLFDHGGHSMGRSMESILLEIATTLIDSDYRFSKLADEQPREFLSLAELEKHKKLKDMSDRQHERLTAMDRLG